PLHHLGGQRGAAARLRQPGLLRHLRHHRENGGVLESGVRHRKVGAEDFRRAAGAQLRQAPLSGSVGVENSIRVGPAVVCAVAVLTVCGCARNPKPSERYAQAHQLFTKLYAAQLDDAFGDPAMAQVDALLRQVPQDSSDWRAARELTRRIEEGRKRLQEAEAARKSAAAQASAPVPYQRMTPEPPGQSAAAAAADAGASQPGPHMALSEFTARF